LLRNSEHVPPPGSRRGPWVLIRATRKFSLGLLLTGTLIGGTHWRAGLDWLRLHDLRHGCATLLLAKGVPDRVIMEVLGHAEIGVTMNTYAHVLPVLRQEAADAIDELFGA
jgi:integrase